MTIVERFDGLQEQARLRPGFPMLVEHLVVEIVGLIVVELHHLPREL